MSYDLIVVGGGPGGYVAAIRAGQLGMKTLLIERDRVGGTCLNRGCIPTKALLHASHEFHAMKTSSLFGVEVDGVKINPVTLRTRKETVVETLCKGVEGLLKANKVEVLYGDAVLTGNGQIEVDGTTYEGASILLAVGGRPSLPPIPGAEQEGVMTSDELLAEVPMCDSITIVGGGVIGMEFASFYADLGVPVTVVEAMGQVLPTLDKEIAQNLGMILKKRGVTIHANASVKEVKKTPDGWDCHFVAKDTEQVVSSSHVLISTGRKANTEGLFADSLAVAMERGALVVDGDFQTTLKGVYAIGDVVAGNIQLAHVASAQGIAVIERLAGKTPTMNLDVVPSCVYTQPEIASVGITEAEGKAQELPVKSAKYLMSGNGRTVIANGDRGFIKVVYHEETKVILGAQLMCERATDMIGNFATAVVEGKTLHDMARIMQPHPTFGEGIAEAVESGLGHSIHQLNR